MQFRKLISFIVLPAFVFTDLGHLYARQRSGQTPTLRAPSGTRENSAGIKKLFLQLVNKCPDLTSEKYDPTQINTDFTEFLVSIAQEAKSKKEGRPVKELSVDEQIIIDDLVVHVDRIMNSLSEIPNLKYTEVEKERHGILRICYGEDKKSVKNNLKKIKKCFEGFENFTPNFFKALALAHDMAKFGEYLGLGNHELLSYLFVRDNGLLNDLELSPDEKKIILLSIKHHLFLGKAFTGEGSLLEVAEILTDFQQEAFTEENINIFWQVVDLFTVTDVASYNKEGFLTDNEVTYVFEVSQDLKSMEGTQDQEKIDKLAQKFSQQRVGCLAGQRDIRGRSNDFYLNKIQEAAKKLINQKEINPEDWDLALKNFYQLGQLYHSIRVFGSQAWMPEGKAENINDADLNRKNDIQEDYEINGNFIKLIIFFTKLPASKKIQFVDALDRPLIKIGEDNFNDQMVIFFEVLNKLDGKAEPKWENDKCYFRDTEGDKILFSPEIYRQGEKLVVKFPEIPHILRNVDRMRSLEKVLDDSKGIKTKRAAAERIMEYVVGNSEYEVKLRLKTLKTILPLVLPEIEANIKAGGREFEGLIEGHAHTNRFDGYDTYTAALYIALMRGLSKKVISDHNFFIAEEAIKAVKMINQAIEKYNKDKNVHIPTLELVPGVEFNVVFNNQSIHLLVYTPFYKHFLRKIKTNDRLKALVEKQDEIHKLDENKILDLLKTFNEKFKNEYNLTEEDINRISRATSKYVAAVSDVLWYKYTEELKAKGINSFKKVWYDLMRPSGLAKTYNDSLKEQYFTWKDFRDFVNLTNAVFGIPHPNEMDEETYIKLMKKIEQDGERGELDKKSFVGVEIDCPKVKGCTDEQKDFFENTLNELKKKWPWLLELCSTDDHGLYSGEYLLKKVYPKDVETYNRQWSKLVYGKIGEVIWNVRKELKLAKKTGQTDSVSTLQEELKEYEQIKSRITRSNILVTLSPVSRTFSLMARGLFDNKLFSFIKDQFGSDIQKLHGMVQKTAKNLADYKSILQST
ncbi:MAG: hypothetical protein ABII74_08885 [Elusimicrobiota bacterium]